MAILTAANFRPQTTDEACIGRELTAQQAEDGDLDATIARMTARIQDLTNDDFSDAVETFELDVWVYSESLMLPKRCTSVTTVKTRDAQGVLTTQSGFSPPSYRLRSSLDAAGAVRLGDFDHLDLVSYGPGLLNSADGSYCWPVGPQTVQVVGHFGWLVVPSDLKRALAHLVWDHYRAQRGDLGRVRQVSAAGIAETFSEDPAMTGIREVDQVLLDYRRDVFLGVG